MMATWFAFIRHRASTQLAEFLLPDEIPGERNLVLQREPVVQVQVATPEALAAAETRPF